MRCSLAGQPGLGGARSLSKIQAKYAARPRITAFAKAWLYTTVEDRSLAKLFCLSESRRASPGCEKHNPLVFAEHACEWGAAQQPGSAFIVVGQASIKQFLPRFDSQQGMGVLCMPAILAFASGGQQLGMGTQPGRAQLLLSLPIKL